MVSRRLTAVVLFFTLGYAALLFRLYDIQLTRGGEYLVRAESQYAAQSLLKAERGGIYFTDKKGKLLPAVTNKDFPLIYAVPKVIEDPSETAYKIAPVLNRPATDLLRSLSKPGDLYEALEKKAPEEKAREVEGLDIPGVYVEWVPERFYPFGKLASHLLGFVAPSDEDVGENGRYGLEELYNEQLTGIRGEIRDGDIRPPRPGKDLILTIDPNIQLEAERILQDLVREHSAKSGSVIVEDPKTGRILAMGSFPNFDPNSYSKFDLSDFLNPVAQHIYEPGSVFKIITMAAGLDSGKVSPETTFYDTGKLELNKRVIRNWDLKANGAVTMSNIIEKSINTGAAFVQRQTGEEIFTRYVQEFGFGDKTGVDLPGELKGDLRRLSPESPAIAFATASFGQGVAVTPIQMINAFAAIANGGRLMRPYVNAEMKPKELGRPIKEETAREVVKMMVSAVDKAGVAKIKGYALAGKTGTAQVPEKGGYSDTRFVNTYIGFGPASNPKFVILFKLDEPAGTPLAGATVVPAFRDLAQFALNYYNIAPDRLQE